MALPANWRVANAIKTLHGQLRPLAPGAPASSFGTVADSAHGTDSDHYPKVFAGLGPWPVVTAGDFPKAGRLDHFAVLDAIRRSRDPRVKYGIANGRMFSSYASGGYPAWTWRPYSGADGHWTHGHLSVVSDARADQTHPWQIGAAAATTEGATMADSQLVQDTGFNTAALLQGTKPLGGSYAGYSNVLHDKLNLALDGNTKILDGIARLLASQGASLEDLDALRNDIDAVKQATASIQIDVDDIQTRTGGIVLTDEQVALFAQQLGLTPQVITDAARAAIDARLDDDATT